MLFALIAVAIAIGFRYYTKTTAGPGRPSIVFAEDYIEVPADDGEAALLQGVTAYDPEDGDITSSIIVEDINGITSEGEAYAVYAAFDSNNHIAKASRLVKLTGYQPPRFFISSSMIFSVRDNYNILHYIDASDVFDGDVSGKIRYNVIGSNIADDGTGEEQIQLRVTNSLGNTVSLPITVIVCEGDPNPAKITLSKHTVYINTGERFNPASYVESYMSGDVQRYSSIGLKISSDVNTAVPGVYTVEYSYGSGSELSRARLFVVVV